jgi:hypothetical protein
VPGDRHRTVLARGAAAAEGEEKGRRPAVGEDAATLRQEGNLLTITRVE